MTITKEDAAQALGEIEEARGRVRSLTGYGYAAPYLILWGIAWLIADTAIALFPTPLVGAFAWPATATIFTVLSLVVSATQARGYPGRMSSVDRWKPMATAIIAGLFLVALFFVTAPLGPKQIHSVFGVFFGAVYVVMGLWIGGRLLVTGLALVALTLGAFYALPFGVLYMLFMGVVVGGGLALGGLWLRKV